jgi:hypothetical protein
MMPLGDLRQQDGNYIVLMKNRNRRTGDLKGLKVGATSHDKTTTDRRVPEGHSALAVLLLLYGLGSPIVQRTFFTVGIRISESPSPDLPTLSNGKKMGSR